jgi:hypothetical protein
MPWNPMRVEQRIGRIDRLGQWHPVIRIVNLHYADTVEADVYRALRERIGLFRKVVGRLQPTLARLPTLIADRVRDGRAGDAGERRAAAAEVAAEAARGAGFDIDAATEADLATPAAAGPGAGHGRPGTGHREAAAPAARDRGDAPRPARVRAADAEVRCLGPGLDGPGVLQAARGHRGAMVTREPGIPAGDGGDRRGIHHGSQPA